jgi:hypothetical protein
MADINEIYTSNRRAAAEAIEKMGGSAQAGRLITERLRQRGDKRSIRVGTVWSWLNRDKKGVPLEFLVDIEEESGVKREQLRGDIPWR